MMIINLSSALDIQKRLTVQKKNESAVKNNVG